MSVFRGQSLGFLGTWGISELWAQGMRGSGAEKVAWFLASLWRVEGGRQSLLLLAVGCRMEDRTPSKESRWDQASENNPDSTSLAPECVLSGNSGPVGIWDTSLVAFCRVKKKITLCFAVWVSDKKQVFLLTLRFSCRCHPPSPT